MSELYVRVKGIVQGVGFRWFVRERARRLGLKGWVRNARDGSVEVAASGGATEIELLRAELLRGPRGAKVDQLEDVGGAPDAGLNDPFDIIH
jgi:acylphosphatase